jgi:hypothetical protein
LRGSVPTKESPQLQQQHQRLPEPLTDTVNGYTIKGCATSVIQCLSNSSVIDFSTKFACFKDYILFNAGKTQWQFS